MGVFEYSVDIEHFNFCQYLSTELHLMIKATLKFIERFFVLFTEGQDKEKKRR